MTLLSPAVIIVLLPYAITLPAIMEQSLHRYNILNKKILFTVLCN